MMNEKKYDWEERLLDCAGRIVRVADFITPSMAGTHVAQQVMRSGTSALPNHGEAQVAESPADFIHKLKLCLKELRETYRWRRLIPRVPLLKQPKRLEPLVGETDELIRMFASSLITAKRNARRVG